MRIWAWAPGTTRTSRHAAGAGGAGGFATGTGPGGISPKSRRACASTSAVVMRPLTASTMPPGT